MTKTVTKKICSIIDSTLREGEQTPGIRLTDDHRRNIIAHLHEVGVDEIELGIASSPANNHLPQLVADARSITQASCRLGLWCRCIEKDIDFAGSCRPDVLSLSIPVSDLHITERLKKNRDWVKKIMVGSIRQGLALDIPFISVGLEDASRADPDFLLQVARLAEENGAWRIRLADTVGICSPGTIRELVRPLQQSLQIDIGVHCHNDFGMATANSIAALEAGASWFDATVLGLGERAGNCRLEEAIGYVTFVLEHQQYHPEFLPQLCRYVSSVTASPIHRNHPLVGDDIFTCETGLHQHGLAVNPTTYEPYEPSQVGSRRKLRFGHKTGTRAINLQLTKRGLQFDDMQVRLLTRRIRSSGKTLSEEQLVQYVTGTSRP